MTKSGKIKMKGLKWKKSQNIWTKSIFTPLKYELNMRWSSQFTVLYSLSLNYFVNLYKILLILHIIFLGKESTIESFYPISSVGL